MEKIELLHALHQHYTKVIERIKAEDYEHARDILKETCTQRGICFCADRFFDHQIFGEDWVGEYIPDNGCEYWYDTPESCYDKIEIIEALQVRVNNLQQEIEYEEQQNTVTSDI